MDYLQLVANPAYDIPKIPYLCNESYDGGSFTGYPERKGWDKQRLFHGDFSEHPPVATAAFLQNWLYFGVVHELLADGMRMEDFITTGQDGQRYIVTPANFGKNLLVYALYLLMSRPRREQHIVPIVPISSAGERWRKCLEEASQLSSVIHTIMEAHYGMTSASSSSSTTQCPCPLPPEVAVSIQVFNSILGSLYLSLYGPHHGRTSWDWGPRWYPRKKMIEAGWCPSDIARLMAYMDVPGTYFASLLRRKETVMSHTECNNKTCRANQIDEGTYVTKHTTEGCMCAHVAAPEGKIEEILRKGKVPVIAVSTSSPPASATDDDNSGAGFPQIELTVHAGTRYVAISHVWSDGLGNATANSLPTCQLLRLAKLTQEVYWVDAPEWVRTHPLSPIRETKRSPVCFWIDTLCVPLERELRIKAITMMNQTYADARGVLILDSEMLRFEREEFLRYEGLLVQTFLSGWSRRVWTLPEGALNAANLWIQLCTGPEKIAIPAQQPLVRRSRVAPDDQYFAIVYNDWLSNLFQMGSCFKFLKTNGLIYRIPGMIFVSSFFNFDVPENLRADRANLRPPFTRKEAITLAFAAALHNLRERSESKPRDKYICLACTLGLGGGIVEKLFDTPDPAGRTKVLLEGVGYVPGDIVLWGGARMPGGTNGWGWAPKDLFDVDEKLHMSGGTAKVDVGQKALGVKVEFEGWVFPGDSGIDPTQGGFYFKARRDKETTNSRKGPLVTYRATCHPTPPTPQHLDDIGHIGGVTPYALIYHEYKAALVSVYRKLPWDGWPREVRKFMQGETPRAIYTKFVCAVRLEEVAGTETEDGPGDGNGVEMDVGQTEEGWVLAKGKPDKWGVSVRENWVEVDPKRQQTWWVG